MVSQERTGEQTQRSSSRGCKPPMLFIVIINIIVDAEVHHLRVKFKIKKYAQSPGLHPFSHTTFTKTHV